MCVCVCVCVHLPNSIAQAKYSTRSIFAEFNKFEFKVFILPDRLKCPVYPTITL